jgi:hypothetical protein
MLNDEIIKYTKLLNENPFDHMLIAKLHRLHLRLGVAFSDLLSNNIDILESVSNSILDYVNTARLEKGHFFENIHPYETLIIPPNYVLAMDSYKRNRFYYFDYGRYKTKDISKAKIMGMFKFQDRDDILLFGSEVDVTCFEELQKPIFPTAFYAYKARVKNLNFIRNLDPNILNHIFVKHVDEIDQLHNHIKNFKTISINICTYDFKELNILALNNPTLRIFYNIYEVFEFSQLSALIAPNISFTHKLPRGIDKEVAKDLKRYISRV